MKIRKTLILAGILLPLTGLTLAQANAKQPWHGTWTRCSPPAGGYTVTMTLTENRVVTRYNKDGKQVAGSMIVVRYEKSGKTIKALVLKTLKTDGSVRKDYTSIAGQFYVELNWDSSNAGELKQVAIKSRTKPRREMKTPYIYKRSC